MTSVTLKELTLETESIPDLEQNSGILADGGGKRKGSGVGNPRTFFGKDFIYWALMVASTAALGLGLSSAWLLGRYYYVHGGSRRWLYTWIQSCGWPVLIAPLTVCYWRRRPTTINLPPKLMMIRLRPTHALTPRLCLIYTLLGAFVTLDNLLYSLGTSYLPVSTNALLCSSQLAFNALFAYLLVRQRMSSYILNSIVIITIGTVLVGVGSDSEKPIGITQREYIVGVVVTIAASAMYGLLLPLLQLVYGSKDVQVAPVAIAATSSLSTVRPSSTPLNPNVGSSSAAPSSPASSVPSFLLVLEVQIAVSVLASVFSFVGMCINSDLAAMPLEAQRFDGGVPAYAVVLVCSAIGWQLFILGSFGIVFLSSSLMSCVFSTVMIPVMPLLAVIFFHDSFSATKGLAMVLSIWGFVSYIYDGYVSHEQSKENNTAS